MPLLTIHELLKETGIARATLYRMIDEGLPFETIGTNRKIFDLNKVTSFMAMRLEKYSFRFSEKSLIAAFH